MPWDLSLLSENPNITLNIVQANPNKKWCWYGISSNPQVLKVPPAEIERTAWRFIAAWRIQRAFKEAYYNPTHKFCKNRLMREFAGMAEDLKT
jgi:hypothetical protein